MKTIEHYKIEIITLIKIFKKFKAKPKKIFVATELLPKEKNYNLLRDRYLGTLKKLGLIIQVPAIYKSGNKYLTRRTVKGYKLKNEKNSPTHSEQDI